MLHTKEYPTSDEALEFIEHYHKRKGEKTTLLLLAECTVDYDGRAKSFLDWGDRLIHIKQDNTLIVHRPTQREPANWQPSGSTIEYRVTPSKHLHIHSRHKNPPEKMNITCRNVSHLTIAQLKDEAKMDLTGMESDIVDRIQKEPDIIEPGLRIKENEKSVKSGLIDLYCLDAQHIPTILEVKRSCATLSNVQQLRMYVQDMKGQNKDAEIRGILCAPRIPDMVKHLLADYGLEWKQVERRDVQPDDWQKSLGEFF